MTNYSNILSYEDYLSPDKVSTIIIDYGIKYTKVGFSLESEPREIIPSLNFYDFEQFHIENMENIGKESIREDNQKGDKNINYYKKEITKEITNQIDEFINNILSNILQLQKKRREKSYHCMLLFNFSLYIDSFMNIFIEKLLDSQLICIVKVLNSNETPIYTSGFTTGLIVNMGHLNTQITTMINGLLYKKGNVNLNMSTLELEKELMKNIFHENKTNPIKSSKNLINNISLSQINENDFKNKLLPYINDLVVKSIIVLNRHMSNEVYSSEKYSLSFKEEANKIDNYKNLPTIYISLYSRICLGEEYFNNKEENLAERILYSIISSPCEYRENLIGNIILSGGNSMSLGLYKRLSEEIIYEIENNKEYSCLLPLKEKVNIHKILFPRNCLSWIGASLISNFEDIKYEGISIHRDDVLKSKEDDENVFPMSSDLESILKEYR